MYRAARRDHYGVGDSSANSYTETIKRVRENAKQRRREGKEAARRVSKRAAARQVHAHQQRWSGPESMGHIQRGLEDAKAGVQAARRVSESTHEGQGHAKKHRRSAQDSTKRSRSGAEAPKGGPKPAQEEGGHFLHLTLGVVFYRTCRRKRTEGEAEYSLRKSPRRRKGG